MLLITVVRAQGQPRVKVSLVGELSWKLESHRNPYPAQGAELNTEEGPT